MDKGLKRLSGPCAEQPMKVKGAETGDGCQVLQVELVIQMFLNMVDHTVHSGRIFSARGLCGFIKRHESRLAMIPLLKLQFERTGPNCFFEIENTPAWIKSTAVAFRQIA